MRYLTVYELYCAISDVNLIKRLQPHGLKCRDNNETDMSYATTGLNLMLCNKKVFKLMCVNARRTMDKKKCMN